MRQVTLVPIPVAFLSIVYLGNQPDGAPSNLPQAAADTSLMHGPNRLLRQFHCAKRNPLAHRAYLPTGQEVKSSLKEVFVTFVLIESELCYIIKESKDT